MRLFALMIAVMLVPFGARADSVDNLGMAAAYLQHCPELRAGPRMMTAAEDLIRRQGKDMDAYRAAFEIALTGIRARKINEVCLEAAEIFGAKGSAERSFLMPRDAAGFDPADILAQNDIALPGDEHKPLALIASFVVVAINECPRLTFSNGFAYLLEKQGYRVEDLTGQGRLTVEIARATTQIYRWAEGRKIVMTGDPMEYFCRVSLERYGPRGSITVDMIREK